jgi:ADP-ribose pyrophosphatase YjhB (NUDIX family)
MRIRGIEIEVLQAEAGEVGAEGYVEEAAQGAPRAAPASGGGPVVLRVSPAGEGGLTDEQSVRGALALSLAEADRLGLATLALPALGTGPGGLTPVAAGKIAAQEIIRAARIRHTNLRAIRLCCRDRGSFDAVEKAVTGYLTHFLDVLLWGPFVTVDAIIEVENPDGGGVVLVRRSNPPFGFALPGGFVEYGETLEEAVTREAFEETGLKLEDLRQLHTYSDPERDPRFHTITTVFSARAQGRPTAGDDAAAVHVAGREEIETLPFAFDHGQIL